jgi:hypothetical protein
MENILHQNKQSLNLKKLRRYLGNTFTLAQVSYVSWSKVLGLNVQAVDIEHR